MAWVLHQCTNNMDLGFVRGSGMVRTNIDEQPRKSVWVWRFELRARSHTTSNRVTPTSTPAESVSTPEPHVDPMPPVVPPPRLHNRLKRDAYGELVPKSKKKANEFRPIKSITVHSVEVSCSEEYINAIVDRPPGSALSYEELCQCIGVPRDVIRVIDVTLSSSTNIQRIEAKYTREETDRRKKAPVDTSLEVDVE
ncbi:hypothetical protein H5410_056824 [Solanum commersonii]|uniref:Uncharacterized protein n=1 Tax=Solanum commersonii TaxID=4109 RepID=A0A9J5WME0_SOLCO|nr:hypothetical protein H5410_056824 [Solanum commersonii]